MTVPTYQASMLPLLTRLGSADRPMGVMELLPLLASDLGLSDADIAVRLPSGNQGLFHNRVHWAKFYMTRAGLIESTRRGLFQITPRGRELLARKPAEINVELLREFPEFNSWYRPGDIEASPRAAGNLQTDASAAASRTPEELIEEGRRLNEAAIQTELLDRVRQMLPGDFEALIIQLLIRMGYGQGQANLGFTLGGTGDGGVDGVVNQDPLGLDRVYIQAKRYKEGSNIGPADINSFIGALNIKRANKGLFVTASSFTKQAREHASSSTLHVVLVDGDRLAELMVRHSVGVVVRGAVEIKAIDEGFFTG